MTITSPLMLKRSFYDRPWCSCGNSRRAARSYSRRTDGNGGCGGWPRIGSREAAKFQRRLLGRKHCTWYSKSVMGGCHEASFKIYTDNIDTLLSYGYNYKLVWVGNNYYLNNNDYLYISSFPFSICKFRFKESSANSLSSCCASQIPAFRGRNWIPVVSIAEPQ